MKLYHSGTGGMPISDDAYAQYQVGFMYVAAYGGQQNLQEGLKWLRGFAA